MKNEEIEARLFRLITVYNEQEDTLAHAENHLLWAEHLHLGDETAAILDGLDGKNEAERKAQLALVTSATRLGLVRKSQERNTVRATRDATLREIRVLTAILTSRGRPNEHRDD